MQQELQQELQQEQRLPENRFKSPGQYHEHELPQHEQQLFPQPLPERELPHELQEEHEPKPERELPQLPQLEL